MYMSDIRNLTIYFILQHKNSSNFYLDIVAKTVTLQVKQNYFILKQL